jgi:hypothetical protein
VKVPLGVQAMEAVQQARLAVAEAVEQALAGEQSAHHSGNGYRPIVCAIASARVYHWRVDEWNLPQEIKRKLLPRNRAQKRGFYIDKTCFIGRSNRLGVYIIKT